MAVNVTVAVARNGEAMLSSRCLFMDTKFVRTTTVLSAGCKVQETSYKRRRAKN